MKKKVENKDNKKIIAIVSAIVIGIIAVTTTITYAFFTYQKNGEVESTIRSGSITFHYHETDGKGHGISITDAMPVSSNVTARSAGTGFRFKITSDTANGVSVPYTVTARMDDNSDAVMGDIVDLYLKDGNNATTIFSSGEVKYNDLLQYNKIANHTEKVIYEGTATGNYEKNFALRMWIDQNANYGMQCSVNPSTNTTQALCTAAQGTWGYQYNGKEFSVTINVYAGDSSVNTYAANQVSYSPSYAQTTCTGANANVECALNELNTLIH